MNMNPFKVSISDEEIEELKQRLRMTRWPDEIPGAKWDYGIPITYMKDIVQYWLYDFDWRKVERRINSFSNYKATIDGRDIHFVYEKGKGMEMSEAERAFLTCGDQWYREEGGYAHLLGTKPQTAAYGLHDSPVGLAAFILEKWYYWTVTEKGEPLNHFSKDDLLANVSIYWFTQTINAANRYYYEGRHIKWPGEGETCPVPHGVSLTKTQPHERPPREYVERLFPNILQWQELNAGGHFVALEQPGLVAESIRSFFNKIFR
ncbi:epoxide hydrolase N-terminal domain-containing protein [Paenibacillus sp. chi10]|uniref:Epoxide hydrolase N-terminal domain-containing protein n=1 Tax=Paenibacillus suaedae TaxID=3077233 RepID=A0AAJ2JS60_9BACL|nr:epoxide hydrolase N-terminal domain-containing protein [Paenibacillus sp. chi10]MDT8974689.1 epoxide hydrolase N-terminal domain-containing protein [Paenibacillus sp. chi10]